HLHAPDPAAGRGPERAGDGGRLDPRHAAGRRQLHRQQAVERAYEVLQRIGAEALAGQRLDRLSGGQKQLAGLAQALAREPRLLLLDEPTSALDLHYQLRVLDLAREAAAERGMTVMIVLHDLQAAARVSDRIAVMAK